MPISLKRAYAPPSQSDGCRILVERLWPRDLPKQDAQIDLWLKEAAPSTEGVWVGVMGGTTGATHPAPQSCVGQSSARSEPFSTLPIPM